MAGKNITQPDKSSVLDAMMSDLGNNRLEDLLDGEDNHHSRHRLAPSANTTNVTKSTESRKGAPRPDGLAKMYRAAIENGEFNDDDAAGVQGLDSLDNGNAHRGKSHAFRLTFSPLTQKRTTNDATGSFPKRPKYDPSNPTYRTGNSKRPASSANTLPRTRPPRTTFNESPRVSSLGGIIPDGGDVKKWDNTKHLTVPNLPAGRGRLVNGQKYPSSGPPAPTVGRGHGNGGVLPNPHNQTIEVGHLTTSGQLPHLRKAPKNQFTASQVPAIPHQGSPSLTEAKAKAIVLDRASNVPNLTTLDARQIFFQGDVLMPNQVGVGGDEPAKGRIVIYELLATPIGVWEITVEGRKVIRGDVRELLEILPDGSKVFLRRWPNKSQVRSEPLRFSNVTEAEIFTFEANIRRLQYTSSSEPIHLENSFDLSPVQDTATPSEIRETPKKAITPEIAITPIKVSGPEFDEFERTTRKKEEENIKRMKEEAEMNAKRVTGKATKEKINTSCLEWSQPEKPRLEKSDPEEPKLAGQTIEYVQPKVDSQQHMLPVSLTTALAVSTPTKAGTNHHTRTGSGWNDSDLINLSPNSASGSRNDFKRSETAESRTTLGVETSKGLLLKEQGGSTPQAPCFVANRAPLRKTETDAMEEVIRALGDVNVLDGVPASADRSGDPLRILRGDPAYYETVVRKSRLLATALECSSGQTLNTAFVASLLHLVESDGFLNLSHEDQKKSLAALYTVVCRGRPRLTRTPDEIRALRSGWETCPQAIRDFNALVRGGWTKGHQRSSTNDSVSFLTDRLKTLSVRHYQG